jgi:protein tyrosine phosphatase
VDLVHLLRSELNGSNVFLMHCSAGVGRTGTLMALNKIIEDIEDEADIIDVFQTVLGLRSDRVLMVSQNNVITVIVMGRVNDLSSHDSILFVFFAGKREDSSH